MPYPVQLLTNNPDKSECLEKYGIDVKSCIPMKIKSYASTYMRKYMETKRDKMGHSIDLKHVVPEWD